MATFTFEGINEYASKISSFVEKSEGMIKRALYDGAAEVMQAMVAEIEALPVVENRYRVTGLPMRGVTETQKAGLLQGIGFAKMRNDGGLVNTKIGFDGYNGVRTKKYPKGQPNALIARAVNSGSSVRVKNPFINRAVRAAKAKAEAAMAARFDADTTNMMK